jgi:hypothetical protein
MSEQKKAKPITLKRTVTIKAVVTDKFKQYMEFELQQGIKTSEARSSEIDSRSSSLEKGSPLIAQLEAEKAQLEYSMSELKKQIENVRGLEQDSHFMQGTVDGFVNINVGDKLYEKLGGMEILVHDGVVKEIMPIASVPSAVTN